MLAAPRRTRPLGSMLDPSSDVPDDVSGFLLGALCDLRPAWYWPTPSGSVSIVVLYSSSVQDKEQVPCMQRPGSVRWTPPGHARLGLPLAHALPPACFVWDACCFGCVSGSYLRLLVLVFSGRMRDFPMHGALPRMRVPAPPHASAGSPSCECQLPHASARLPPLSCTQAALVHAYLASPSHGYLSNRRSAFWLERRLRAPPSMSARLPSACARAPLCGAVLRIPPSSFGSHLPNLITPVWSSPEGYLIAIWLLLDYPCVEQS